VGRYREDVIELGGNVRRVKRSVILGKVCELTRREATRRFEPYLSRVNVVGYRPERFAKLGDFSEPWEREVLQQHKPSSI